MVYISQVTADHAVRPIIVPRDVSILPWSAGYAETINAGKSRHNEDQAMARQGSIGVVVGGRLVNVPYTMFAVFDGHAGAGCAVTASNDLWQAIQVRLRKISLHYFLGAIIPDSQMPSSCCLLNMCSLNEFESLL